MSSKYNFKKRKLNTQLSYVSKVATVEDGSIKVFNYVFKCPKIAYNKIDPIDRILCKGKKFSYLNDSSHAPALAVTGAGALFTSDYGQSNHTDVTTVTSAQLKSMYEDLNHGYPNLTATSSLQNTDMKCVYFHNYVESTIFFNAGNAAISCELYDIVARDEVDSTQASGGSISETIESVSKELPYALAGFKQNTYSVTESNSYIRVPARDDDYRWHLNHYFCKLYKVVGTRRFTIPAGGKFKVNVVYQLHQNLSFSDFISNSQTMYKGFHGIVLRQIGELCLGGAAGSSTTGPDFAPTSLAYYRRIVRSGFVSGQSIGKPISTYGKAGVTDDSAVLRKWQDDSDTMVTQDDII